ncbi:MAG: hypothetical protein U5P10_00070 [Spirochaetia bacterium]|nr:hypothetical protein [Spirochaetia bacterium]
MAEMFEAKFRASKENPNLPVNFTLEETKKLTVTCNNCGLEFSVYGVFARCPDCANINAFTVFERSLSVIHKEARTMAESQ